MNIDTEPKLHDLKGEEIKELLKQVSQLKDEIIRHEKNAAELKRVQEELKASKALYQSLVDSLPQNAFQKDLDGKFILANATFCKSLRKPLHEVLGKTDYDFYTKELADKYRADDKNVIETGKLFEDIERHELPNGEKIFVHVIKTPVYDFKGDIVATQCIFWDVTKTILSRVKIVKRKI